MIRSFKSPIVKDVLLGKRSKATNRVCPETIWKIARRKLTQLNTATCLDDLRIPPANHLEMLRGNRYGQYSIRINNQYRICFTWRHDAAEDVEIIDYH